MSALDQISNHAEQIEQSDLSQFEKKVLAFAEHHCKVRADLVQAAGVILRMIQNIDSAQTFNELYPISEIRSCSVMEACTVVEFNEGGYFHSGDIDNARPSDIAELPSLRIE
jgi:hypothetical protein